MKRLILLLLVLSLPLNALAAFNEPPVGAGGSAMVGDNGSAPSVAPNASAQDAVGIGSGAVAAGVNSVAIGPAFVLGENSLAGMIGDSTSAYGGQRPYSFTWGYLNKIASGGQYQTILGGSQNSISGGDFNTAIGCYQYTGTGFAGSCFGAYQANSLFAYTRLGGLQVVARAQGEDAWGGGRFSVNGDAQAGRLIMKNQTTSASSVNLYNNYPTNTLVYNLPNNSSFRYTADIIGRSGTGNTTALTIRGVIKRGATAGTTALAGTAVKEFFLRDVPAWDCSPVADTTAGGLTFSCSGAASTTVNWVAEVRTVQVVF